ncbi:hypothetical protein V499_04742 [Pseudogymnoascus sp. VKM F-103]|nr:hypothetical protein V499_04742 [Pseudogymnoascus sp. VKM F-103]
MNEFNEIRGDVADKLAEKLGIHQWYNLHMTDMCMGTYTPRATDEGAKMNVSRCTPMKAMYHFDPTSQLQKELDSGPLAGKINLADLGYSDDIKNGIKAFNIAMTAMFILPLDIMSQFPVGDRGVPGAGDIERDRDGDYCQGDGGGESVW